MRFGIKSGRTSTRPSLRIRPAGHALLIHPRGKEDPEAVAFAARLAPDPQHTLVVVDLPFGSLGTAWEVVAGLVARRSGSLRLVFARATPQESRQAAQRIADQLERLVLVPDGDVLPTAGGGLFIPADRGAGWLSLRPGFAVERDSQRYPKPLWEFSALDRPWEISPHGVVEPVPSGAWLRSARPAAYTAGWQRLVSDLPSHPAVMTVVLGSPGGPPVRLSDVARFWRTVLPFARANVRFVHFGPVTLPEGRGGLGQALADTFDQQVVLSVGLPSEVPTGPEAADVAAAPGRRADGSSGWRPFVTELAYSPRAGDTAPPPTLFGPRAPVPGMPELSSGVYAYAPDAVLEVVQSGLWMRPRVEPAGGDDVRRIPAGPGHCAILYDRSSAQTAERMRMLAEDVLWRLEPTAREAASVAPADAPGLALSAAGPDVDPWAVPATGDADAWDAFATARAALRRPAHMAPWQVATSTGAAIAGALPSTSRPEGRRGSPAEAHISGGAQEVTGAAIAGALPSTSRMVPDAAEAPGAAAASTATAAPGSTGTGSGDNRLLAPTLHTAPPTALAPPALVSAPPSEASGPHSGSPVPTATAATGLPTPPAIPATPAEPAPGPVAAPTPGPATTVPGASAEPAAGPSTLDPTPPAPAVPSEPSADVPAPDTAATPTEPPAPAPAARQSARAPGVPRIRLESGVPVPSSVPSPTPPRATGPTPAPVPTTLGAPAATPEVRVQSAPKAAACAVPPERGLDQERAWVRRAFSTQYHAIASTVSRVMSESPGLRNTSRALDDSALTDLVAVRLYLSGDSAAVDTAIRGATVGPHIPLARCVAAGLRRLPSYRGATLLRATVTSAERAWYREGRVATEWAFCTAQTASHTAPEGSTDFLIWAMTARRTSLLDPALPHRVLFLPGTAFKVLPGADDTQGPVLLRELSPSEHTAPAEDPVDPAEATNGRAAAPRLPLDEIALESLQQAVAALAAEATPARKSSGTPSTAPASPPGTPPGLIIVPPRPRARPAGSARAPIEGAKP